MLKKYRQSFATSELGRLHALFPFSELARQMHLKSSALGRKSYFSPEGKIALMVLKSYTNFSDAQLIEHLNGNIHYQLFCGVQIDPLHPLTNPKIVSAIRQELADRLDIESLFFFLADHFFNRRQSFKIRGRYQHKCPAGFSRAPRASDPVNVIFGIDGIVKIKYVRHVRQVQPARGNVGTNQQLNLAVSKSVQRFRPRPLRHVAVQRGD